MTTAIKRDIMKEAHKIAKKMTGDYIARLALALRKVWQKVKNNKEVKEMININNFFRTDKDATNEEQILKDRNEWEQLGIQEIKKIINEGNFQALKERKDSIICWANENLEKLLVKELASGLRLTDGKGNIISGINRDQFETLEKMWKEKGQKGIMEIADM